jgi:hypothetical protein
MRFLDLDASGWRSVDDFYEALLGAVGAPHWHGCSPDALTDSMIWGGINEVEPPYTVRISGTADLRADVLFYINDAIDCVKSGRDWRRNEGRGDIEVSIEIVS